MAKQPRNPVTYYLSYCVQFSVQCESTVHAAEQQEKDCRDRERIWPAKWDLDKSCAMGDHSWLQFTHDQEFDRRELQQVTRNLQLLDDAFEAMTRGTKAEEKKSEGP
jgi:hypothetical protein